MKPSQTKVCASCGERYDADVLFCPRDGTPLASARAASTAAGDRDPYLGIELTGQIRLTHLIGIGSMGRVYRAFQAGIDRDVAVKILHRELSGNAELCARFHREAKVASRLVHAGVVQVLMTGTIPAPSGAAAATTPTASGTQPAPIGGELYLVMEYLDGMSLMSALAAADGGALALPRALHVVTQICDAVGEAHEQGIVHRDLKPENIMLVRRGDDPDFVKVLDFGIARVTYGDASMATQAGLIFGTAKYISPEGAEGQSVGPAADVYAIATMLYQCLAGRTPFEGESPVALLVQHTHSPPPELRTVARASYVPQPIADVVMKNLGKKAADRSPNARALGRELVAAARASGLDPDEIVAHSALVVLRGRGAVKLASKERTKQHELSADLASKIGGIASTPPVAPAQARASREVDPDGHDPLDDAEDAAAVVPRARSSGKPSARPSRPGRRSSAPPAPPSARSRPRPSRPPELDFDDGGAAPPSSGLPSARRAPRARMVRGIAIALCAAAAAMLVVFGGYRLGGFGASASGDSVEAQLESARDAMRRRAWTAPPRLNVREITLAAAARWPDDPRIRELRREAAERALSEAFGRKYGGDVAGALELAQLSLELDPALTTAQHLVAELQGARPDVAPGPSSEPASSARPDKNGKRPAKDPKDARSATSAASAAPSATVSAGPAVLPPTPPPLPSDHAPPAPASSRPWL